MTESERNFYLAELSDKTKIYIQMKIDRRAGKYVSRARMERVEANIRQLQDILYPRIETRKAKINQYS